MKPLELPLHPWLLAAYPLIALATSNFGQVSVQSLAIALAVAWAVVATLVLGARHLCRDWFGSALLTSVLIAIFFSYGHVHGAVDSSILEAPQTSTADLPDDSAGRLWHMALSGGGLLVLLGTVVAVRKLSGLRSTQTCAALNVTATFLLAATGVQAALSFGVSGAHRDGAAGNTEPGSAVSALGYNPDIYYIILDGYARADILRQYYDFDNSAFVGALQERGFTVNERGVANYYWTFLSLGSSLNMEYLQTLLPEAIAAGRPDRGPAYRAVRDNRAARFLRGRGYRIVHLRSSWGATFANPYADQQLGCEHRFFDDEYFRVLAETTWLRLLQQDAAQDLASCHLQRLRLLAGQARQPGPKFVFAHFLPPHHPYLFDRNGSVVRHATVSNQFNFQAKLWDQHAPYVEQLQFVNRSMLALIDRLLAESARTPIIILQSDHGPQLMRGLTQPEQRRARLANFSAFLLPGATAAAMPGDTAPVNIFRRLFNHYFGANFAILPQHSYYSAFRKPYDLEMVPPSVLAAGSGTVSTTKTEQP